MKITWAAAVRRALRLAPMEAIRAVTVVPTSMPITRAQAWGRPITPAARAARVVATPAPDDWVITVLNRPSSTSCNRPSGVAASKRPGSSSNP